MRKLEGLLALVARTRSYFHSFLFSFILRVAHRDARDVSLARSTSKSFAPPRTNLTPRLVEIMLKPLLSALFLALGVRAEDFEFTANVRADVDVRVLTADNHNASAPSPLLVYLHGFCLDDDAQQTLELSSMRTVPGSRNRLGMTRRRQQRLVQTGLREAALAEDMVYIAPDAPRTTNECVLCNLQNDSPNSQDRLFASWITGILERDSPSFQCRAWDGSDAVALADVAATDSRDVDYVLDVVAAAKKTFNIDEDRVYVVGVATGGFMATRLACERPDVFRGVVSIAGGTFADAERCRPPRGARTSVLAVHGTDDHTVPIKGGVNSRGVAFPSSDESFKTLGEAMGCSNVVRKGEGEPLPADSPGLDVAVETRTFASCDDGVSVEQWKLFGVDHFMERPTSERLFENVIAWLTALR